MGVLLASVHALITLLWLGLLSLGAGAAAGWLRRPLFSRLLDGITGGVLIGLGVRTALEQG
jgi:threonine/homoserine/homoserine lactone efflux protein